VQSFHVHSPRCKGLRRLKDELSSHFFVKSLVTTGSAKHVIRQCVSIGRVSGNALERLCLVFVSHRTALWLPEIVGDTTSK
jgi:hypothetical protein